MSEAKRKHRPTGNPRGGPRLGAGRKLGTNNALPRGAVSAIKALRLRLPEGTSEDAAEIAEEAFAKTVAVMRGEVSSFEAPSVLKAATQVRLEVCGPIAQRVDVGGKLLVDIQINTSPKPEGT